MHSWMATNLHKLFEMFLESSYPLFSHKLQFENHEAARIHHEVQFVSQFMPISSSNFSFVIPKKIRYAVYLWRLSTL